MQNRSTNFPLRVLGCLLALAAIFALAGCQGVSSASKQTTGGGTGGGTGAGQLAVAPTTMTFGDIAVGANSAKQGTLTAGSSDIKVTSAAWTGQGYSVSGITFPVTVPAGQSLPFTVTFAPEAAGTTPGSIAFDSDATNSPTAETFTGDGTQQSQSGHSVALSWDPSTSQVIGYNIYRGTTPGGPYTKVNAATNTAYTDSSVQSGQTYYYVTTAVDSSNVESAYSNQATAAIP